jgi:non-ribosomal peptide synthetase component F
MTVAFDFSVEEIWVPLLAGATLVPRPGGASLLGHELWEFLEARRVTALCCVPTLLATLEDDLPGLRFLLVSGEACPHDLVVRWHRPGRRFLNVYGPTEATVSATWAVVDPDRPVTIGVPLPTYSVVILDPAADAGRSNGDVGEIGIAGIGLARGYLNRPDLTAERFVPNPLADEGRRTKDQIRSQESGVRSQETGDRRQPPNPQSPIPNPQSPDQRPRLCRSNWPTGASSSPICRRWRCRPTIRARPSKLTTARTASGRCRSRCSRHSTR